MGKDEKEEYHQRMNELYKKLDYDKVWKDFAQSVKGKKPKLDASEIVTTKEFEIE